MLAEAAPSNRSPVVHPRKKGPAGLSRKREFPTAPRQVRLAGIEEKSCSLQNRKRELSRDSARSGGKKKEAFADSEKERPDGSRRTLQGLSRLGRDVLL